MLVLRWCYNLSMPTKEWTKTRKLKTFWITHEEDDAFRAACIAAERGQAEVLREAVQVMIDDPAPARAK